MKKVPFKRFLALLITMMMILPSATFITASDTVSEVVYSDLGPASLPVGFGDSTWQDYEFEFDITPKSGSGFRVAIRGGAYYSWMDGSVTSWPGLQPESGQGGAGWAELGFAIGEVTHMRFVVKGSIITLYGKGPNDSTERQIWQVDVATFGGNLVLNGGVAITSEGLDATITNIVARDLKGNLTPIDPPEPPGDVTVVIDEPDPILLNSSNSFDKEIWYGNSTWKNYIIEADVSNLGQNPSDPYEWWNFQFRFRNNSNGKFYYTYINSAQVDLKDTITWNPTWVSGTANSSPTTSTVSYKFVVIDNVITAYANGIEIFTYTDDYTAYSSEPWDGGQTYSRSILSSGMVGLAVEGATCTVENLKVTLLDEPEEPVDPNEPVIINLITEPLNAGAGDSEWYGETTWKDYIVETTLSNLTVNPDDQYSNFQFRLRGESGSYYFVYITSTGRVNLQDTIGWAYLTGSDGPSAAVDPVDYKFEVIGDVIKIYANDNLLLTYTENRSGVHTQGQIGWASDRGSTCTIESLSVTLLDDGGGSTDPGTTTGSIEILSPKVPEAGVYPVSAFKYRPNAWDNNKNWNYTETIVWSPAIQNTFLPDTAYKATVTLTRVSGTGNMFTGKTVNDLGGVPLTALPYATVITADDTTMVIEFNFPATGSTVAEFEEFKNTLFYDDFSSGEIDYTKWDNPLNYQQDRQGNSKWEPRNVSIADGNLRLRFAKENADNNWISASALRTRNQFDNAYGYYEARIKYPAIDPTQSGAWGAFWLMFYNSNLNGGKDGTEIDIVEFAGVHKHWASGALHWDGYGTNHKSTGFMRYDTSLGATIYDGEFHTYALEWTPTEYISYVDGIVAGRVTRQDMQNADPNGGICENPLYIKLSIESSAPTNGTNWNDGWGGPVAPGVWEDYMEVDYVVVYDRPKTAAAIYITDHVTLDLDAAYENGQVQVKATVKNVNEYVQGAVSGTVYLDTPEGIILGETSKTYENLAYGETAVLYFDVNPDYVSNNASELIKFNYTVDGLEPVGSAQFSFGFVEAAKAVEEDIFIDSSVIDFVKGTAKGGTVSASTLDFADLSATGKLAWDENYLYAQIVVTDNIHYQANSAGNRWQDDGLQISVGNNVGWREVEFVLANDLSNIYQQCYSNSTGASGGTGTVDQGSSTMESVITRDEDSKTTTYDIKISWDYMGIDDPKAGDAAKIAITINDNDGSGRKDLAYFDGISTGEKGKGMGYLLLMPEIIEEETDEITINFEGVEGVKVEYYTNVTGWKTVAGTFDNSSTFAIPNEDKATHGATTIRVGKGGMTYSFTLEDGIWEYDIPVSTITVTGIGFDCNLSIVGSNWVYQNIASIAGEAAFNVFGGRTYELRISKSGFDTISIPGIACDGTVDISGYFYEIAVPETVSNIRLQSNNWIVDYLQGSMKPGNVIDLLKTGKPAKISFVYDGEAYDIEFTLDGTNPFDGLSKAEPVLVSASTSSKSVKIVENSAPKNTWTVTFVVRESYSDGTVKDVEYTFTMTKNSNGSIDLGNGYTLIYDIKGNGSNIKKFELKQN